MQSSAVTEPHVGPDVITAPAPEHPHFISPSHPPPVQTNSTQSYNIHQRLRPYKGLGGRANHSPSIRQSWLFPTNRASPSTALPETTSVMTLNQRPRTETLTSSTTAQNSPPSVVLNHKERRNFSGSARSRLTKIDRLSKMMLNPSGSAPNLLDGHLSGLPTPASPRRTRLSLQPHTIPVTDTTSTSISSLASIQTSSDLSTSSRPSQSPIASSISHTTTTSNNNTTTSNNNSYPRHIVMHATPPLYTIEGYLANNNTITGDSLSSSLPSTSAFAEGVDPSHNSDLVKRPNLEKANRHASMPLPKPGWRLYDLPDVAEPEAQQNDFDGGSSGMGEERSSFQYNASNASSTTNLDNNPYSYRPTAHTRQSSSSTFYTMTPNASHPDLSLASSNNPNLNLLDLASTPSDPSGLTSPPPPLPKAVKNTKSPLALRRSSMTSSVNSASPSNTFMSKGSLPKSSLSSNTVLTSKTLTLERQKIILEILRTERSYVDGLIILQTLFHEPLNAPYATTNNLYGMHTTSSLSLNNGPTNGLAAGAGSSMNTMSSTSSGLYYASSTVGSNSTLSPLLSKKSVNEIFSNFSEILQINTLLLTQLETRICGDTLSTGWESEDETDQNTRNDVNEDRQLSQGGEGGRKGSSESKTKPNQVLVTVQGQNGEQEELLVLDADWCIGDIFIEIAPFLKMYSNYVKTFASALTHINDCMNRNERLTEFLKNTEKRPECKNLDFQAYLMLPVQRIPRYKMLLEGLLRHTPEDHPDHRKLQTAFESMAQTAIAVNETTRQHEMFLKMVELQSKIAGMSEQLVTPGRTLLKHGSVWKVCRRNVQVRVLILLSDCILWTSPSLNPLLDDTLTFHRKVGLENCTVIGAEDPDPTKNAFQIISSEKSSQVYVDTLKEKEEWMDAIRKATQDFLSAKRTLKISITPMQSISAAATAATSFGVGLLRRETGLWSPSPFSGNDFSRSNAPLGSPVGIDPEFAAASASNGALADGNGYQSPMEPSTGLGVTSPLAQKTQPPLRVVENYNAPVWVPDHSATRCMICSEEFGTLFRRKHHCRACGKVVCHSCSSRNILIRSGNSEKVGRACDDCIDTMFPEEEEALHAEPVLANAISSEPLLADAFSQQQQQQQQYRGSSSDVDRRASNQSLDGVIIQPEDYSPEHFSSGAAGMVRGLVEASLNR
ncbi:hypothetical protein BX616_001428, partial [Lobosporangium transversale]